MGRRRGMPARRSPSPSARRRRYSSPRVEGRAEPATTSCAGPVPMRSSGCSRCGPRWWSWSGDGAPAGVRFGPGDRGQPARLRRRPVDRVRGPRPAGRTRTCRSPTPSARGCSTRPGSRHPRRRRPRRRRRSRRATCPGRSGCSPWATARPAGPSRPPGTSTTTPRPSTPRSPRRWRPATPRRWPALDPAEGERLLAAGVPTWRAVGAALAGRDVAAALQLDAAPFGVGYLVADWVAA